jgi:hypothetical protein
MNTWRGCPRGSYPGRELLRAGGVAAVRQFGPDPAKCWMRSYPKGQ